MFCWNCGTPIDEDQKFCTACGAAQNQQPAPVQPEPVVTQPEAEVETAVLSEPEAQPEPFAQPESVAQPEFNVNTFVPETPKKKKKKLGGLIAALVAVAGLVVGSIFCWPYITSFWNRTFLKPEKYLVKVYEKNLEKDSVLAPLTGAYGSVRNSLSNSTTSGSGQVDISMSVDEDLIKLLETSAGGNVDLSWFNQVMLSVISNVTEEGVDVSLGLGLNDTRIVTMQALIEYAGKVYVGYPELSDTYLAADIDMNTSEMQDIMAQSVAASKALANDLPTEEEMNALLSKYVTVALGALKDVDKKTKKVSVGDFSQQYTLLVVEISEEDAADMVVAVLKEAKKDKTLRQVVEAYVDYTIAISEMQGITLDQTDMDVDALFDSIDEAIDYFNEYEPDDEDVFAVTTYVDMQDRICGYKITVFGDEEYGIPDTDISFLTARKGNKFEFEAEIAEAMVITGSGTEKKDVVTASYAVEVEGQEIIVLELEDFTTTETISGTVRLKPGKALAEQLVSNIGGSEIASLFGGTDIALEFVFNASSVDIRVMVAKKSLVSLKLETKTSTGSEFQAPDKSISAESNYQLTQWYRTLDPDKVVENLKKAGVSEDAAEAFAYGFNQAMQQLLNQFRYY